MMIEVAAFITTMNFFASADTSAAASAFGVSRNPARMSTLSRTTSSSLLRWSSSPRRFPTSLHETQRLEAAGAPGVVLEKEAVHLRLAEHRLGDRVVAARGHPHAGVVTAAGVHRDGEIAWAIFQERIYYSGVLGGQLRRVLAVAPHLRADALVAQAGERDVVDLQVRAAGGHQVADLFAVGTRDVAPEFLHVRVGLRIDDLAAASHVEVGGSGDAQLCSLRGRAFQELERLEHDGSRPSYFLVYDHHRARLRLGAVFAVELERVLALVATMPSRPVRKSTCQKARRNSPSVTTCRPAASCIRTASRMQSSSIFLSCGDFSARATGSRC